MCPPGHHDNSFVATFALEDTIYNDNTYNVYNIYDISQYITTHIMYMYVCVLNLSRSIKPAYIWKCVSL